MGGAGEQGKGGWEENNHKELEMEMWAWLLLALPGQFSVLLVTIKPTSLT